MAETGLAAEFKATTTARTGGGGYHFVFELPPGAKAPPSRSKLRPGIDIRSEGGQICVQPTIHPNGNAYAWERAPWDVAPKMASAALMSLLEALSAPPRLEIVAEAPWHPAMGNGHSETPFEWIRRTQDFHTWLVRFGWTHLGGEAWKRPGKTDRGSSAQLKNGGQGPLNVFTTEVPAELERLDLSRTGDCLVVTLADLISAYMFGGDERECARWARQQLLPLAPSSKMSRAADVPEPGDSTAPSMNLPEEFWQARPHLRHIVTAARAAECSPDALLIHALARTATFVHPCFKLPGVEQGLIGKHQTLDFLGCVVAETSGGKTLAAGVGELLIPAPDPPADGSDPPIDFEQKVGSGEGIAEFFLVPDERTDDEGNTKVIGRKIGKQGLFMSVDEGTGFTNQTKRNGTTIVATLASAWSGESLGQLNADQATRRLVRGGRVRICAVINMQDSNGYKLYTEDLESVGFTGRLLFASAHDPEAPEVETRWPGVLEWPIRPGYDNSNVYFTYAAEIAREIKSVRHQILTKRLEIDRRQSQYLLLRCKVAALLAVWEDRLDVTEGDWELATQIVQMSGFVLSHLDTVHSSQAAVTAVTAAVGRKNADLQANDIITRRLAAGWRAKVIDRLRKGPRPWRELRLIVDSDRRDDLKRELEAMLDEGLVVIVDRRYELGE